jgi:EAL domain-containing protein (putative c-di-GMP-specific phosphodiesterase class I)
MVDDPKAAMVARKAIEMAHDLGMSVIGEGVETNDELNALRRMRCDRIQGWLTGRPAPLEEFIAITVDRPTTHIDQPRDAR